MIFLLYPVFVVPLGGVGPPKKHPALGKLYVCFWNKVLLFLFLPRAQLLFTTTSPHHP
jgi:hypothetical protein